ncbi:MULTISPECIES: acetyl-CoA C-acyltransferase [Bradyrhizobium]|uniref:acetyl-CoA C-acyltransferase n=1 Tax=Bradyrhizobium TaxID=374 RepID=UPI00040D3C7A|nr:MULTISPECIES: acetyl-CoA C-acyltransferase [Bradyrhizobium]WLB87118.1 acetyl-CoA C-acyltransferase [Bradyrhizobium japonicum USDA 135]GLR93934.1 acetyl-CoA acetyltransferase [Bradyrhizobium liaoningense]
MANKEVVICSPVRTAIGTYGGTLKDLPAVDLGAVAIRATLERAKLSPGDVGTIVMGNVIQAGNKMNPARQAAINGGVPVAVPALTVNRVCGSGAQAIASATQEVMLGFVDSAVAGGMENMDRAPYLMGSGRWGYRMGDAKIFDAMLMDGLNDAFSGQHSGWHTEDLAASHQITREEQDRWAERSQKRFSAAQTAGKFAAEIAAVEIASRKGPAQFDKDEHNRPDTTMESLGKLKPAFRKDGTITAGNAPGLNTGASAMIVADRAWADKKGLLPMARLVAYGIGAVEPGMFGLGPVPAVKQALERAGWKVSDVQRIEINEAFAAIAIAVAKDLGLDASIVNVEGGAIAHGHPIGASGAVLTTRLLHSMKRDGIKKGIVTLCIGGGQGIALALESIN